MEQALAFDSRNGFAIVRSRNTLRDRSFTIGNGLRRCSRWHLSRGYQWKELERAPYADGAHDATRGFEELRSRPRERQQKRRLRWPSHQIAIICRRSQWNCRTTRNRTSKGSDGRRLDTGFGARGPDRHQLSRQQITVWRHRVTARLYGLESSARVVIGQLPMRQF